MPDPDAAPPSPCRVRRDGREYTAQYAEQEASIWIARRLAFTIAAGNWIITYPDPDDGRLVIANVQTPSEFALNYEVLTDDEG